MLSGYKLIRELGKEGLRGEFFSYEQYKKIAKVKKFNDLKIYLSDSGFKHIEKANNEAEIVQSLKKNQSRGYVTFTILELLFWTIFSFGGCS
jgi:hypothetical protein